MDNPVNHEQGSHSLQDGRHQYQRQSTQPLNVDSMHSSAAEDPASMSSASEQSDHDTNTSNLPARRQDREDEKQCKMHKYTLYETSTRFYLVGADIMERKHKILQIDRTADSGQLTITENHIVYSKPQMSQLINTIDDGNKNSGGLCFRSFTWGLLGFIRFTGEYYMLLITKRSQVAMLGGHYIYQIDDTELVPLTSSSMPRSKIDRHPEETRFVNILKELDLSRSFYFSYSYDVTNTLQKNIMHEREHLNQSDHPDPRQRHNEMFIWNHYLLEPALSTLKSPFDWCLPIIHGFVDQATISIYGRIVYITIIARRSRFFAGARYLKRGANDLGYVANDVETEQIVSEMLTTSFHAPGVKPYANPSYTSYVQHRGSIPLYWTQDSAGVTPKPDIELNLVDPFYGAAALHFDNLFQRYGAPIYVLNLIKSRERTPRESKLLKEYTTAIDYLNQFLPQGRKIVYKAWDMSRASKSRDQDVIRTLENTAKDVLELTGFFHNGEVSNPLTQLQNGIARTNCIDCLDRTNAAQFVIGKLALGHQLHALGVIGDTSVNYDTDAVNMFTHMFHDHGDTIAIQYGGSHLVNTMETYRKINQWSSHSRDMVESFKRYYNNSFLDGQRQEAYNLFLGNYIFSQGQPMLWDLSTDYYLHHADPRSWLDKKRRSYVHWYTPSFLKSSSMPPVPRPKSTKGLDGTQDLDDYWLEYYRPLALSSFAKIFSYRMNSTLRYMPFKTVRDTAYDFSPFRKRDGSEQALVETEQPRKGVKILDPSTSNNPTTTATTDFTADQVTSSTTSLTSKLTTSILKEVDASKHAGKDLTQDGDEGGQNAKDKGTATQWTLSQFVKRSLEPEVPATDMEEYARYISHPLNLPLVVSSEIHPDPSMDFINYVQQRGLDTAADTVNAEDVADYTAFLHVDDDPLTVLETDLPKKRYKAYRQWLKGKSLFKQHRIDP